MSKMGVSLNRSGTTTKSDWYLLIASFIQFVLVIPLAWWARKHPHPPVEIGFSRLLQRKQRSFKRSFVAVLNTMTGSAVVLNILTVPIAALLWKKRLRLEALMLVATCWMSGLAREALKLVINRPRPKPLLVRTGKKSLGKSFPSGHTASAVTLWGWLGTLLLVSQKKGQPSRRALAVFPALFILFTGPARVYLGDHWATDVLGGYFFGGGWLTLSLRFYFRWKARGISPAPSA